jgi:valyl-tRNA synthetase
MLRLLHPIMPFVTEELFAKLSPAMSKLGLWLDGAPQSEMLVRDRFPAARRAPDPEIEARFAILQRFVIAARQLRAAYNIKDNVKITVGVKALSKDTRPMLEKAKESVAFLARLEGIEWAEERKKGMAAQYDPAFELYLDLSKYIDLSVELERLGKEIGKTEKELASSEKTLANPDFAMRAPPEKVEAAKARAAELKEKLEKLIVTKTELSGLT